MAHEEREDGGAEPIEEYLKDELKEEHRERERLQEELRELDRREERTENELERLHEREKHKQFHLVFLINGEDFRVQCLPHELLRVAVEKVLHESGNTGRREISEWEVRDEEGSLLNMGKEIEKLGLKNDSRLFLSLQVAAGGAHAG